MLTSFRYREIAAFDDHCKPIGLRRQIKHPQRLLAGIFWKPFFMVLSTKISDHQQSWGYADGPWKGPGPPLLVAADFLGLKRWLFDNG